MWRSPSGVDMMPDFVLDSDSLPEAFCELGAGIAAAGTLWMISGENIKGSRYD